MAIESGFPVPAKTTALQLGDLFVFEDVGGEQLAVLVEWNGDRYGLIFKDAVNAQISPYLATLQGLPGVVRHIQDEVQAQPLADGGFGKPDDGYTRRGLLHVSAQGEVFVAVTPKVGSGSDWFSLKTGLQSRAIDSNDLKYASWQLARRSSPQEPWVTVLEMRV